MTVVNGIRSFSTKTSNPILGGRPISMAITFDPDEEGVGNGDGDEDDGQDSLGQTANVGW